MQRCTLARFSFKKVSMMVRVELLTKDDEPAYERLLENCMYTSAQNSLEWFKVIQYLKEDRPYIVVAKEKDDVVGALPLFNYPCKFGDLLTTIAWQSTSNIICSKNSDQKKIYGKLLDFSLTLAKELDCIALSVSTSPFRGDDEYYLRHWPFDFAMENFVQYVRIDEIFNLKGDIVHPNYVKRTNLRRNLEKTKKSPVRISLDQTKANVSECWKIYEKRMRELGAASLPKEFFMGVLNELTPKGKGKFLFAFHQGKMIGCCLFLPYRTILDVPMMTMDSEYKKFGANYLFSMYMLNWAHQNSISIVNWMSSPRKGDGVYKWKKQWGSHECNLLYLTRILGDISHWSSMSHVELFEAYRFHYLLPYNLLKSLEPKFTTKDELTIFLQSRNSSSKGLVPSIHMKKRRTRV